MKDETLVFGEPWARYRFLKTTLAENFLPTSRIIFSGFRVAVQNSSKQGCFRVDSHFIMSKHLNVDTTHPERITMLSIQEIREDQDLVNAIDWDMTPEEAVTLYLEWGNNWSHGRMIKSKDDVSHYFVVDTWESPPKIFLVRRNSVEAVELAAIDIPEELRERFLESVGGHKGVYAIDGEIRGWLVTQLGAHHTIH